MRRAVLLLAALGAALTVTAPPAVADVAYEAVIDSPRGVVRGTVVIEAHVAGGVGEAEFAAYRAASDWLPMDKVGEATFASTSRPWSTEALPNGTYRLEVRVWGDVPPYDPDDPRTYASDVVTVDVDNRPPVPRRLRASFAGGAVELSWRPVPTETRGDFLGYRVLGAQAASCLEARYRVLADTSATAFSHPGVGAGTWCYRVAALRASTVSGQISSAPSRAASVIVAGYGTTTIPDAFGGLGATGAREAEPPPAPRLGEGSLEVSDGRFAEQLPYGSGTITQQVEGAGDRGLEELADEPGVGPRQGLTLVATGLVLATFALLLRRFLASAPDR